MPVGFVEREGWHKAFPTTLVGVGQGATFVFCCKVRLTCEVELASVEKAKRSNVIEQFTFEIGQD
jgi:hypothetical protein